MAGGGSLVGLHRCVRREGAALPVAVRDAICSSGRDVSSFFPASTSRFNSKMPGSIGTVRQTGTCAKTIEGRGPPANARGQKRPPLPVRVAILDTPTRILGRITERQSQLLIAMTSKGPSMRAPHLRARRSGCAVMRGLFGLVGHCVFIFNVEGVSVGSAKAPIFNWYACLCREVAASIASCTDGPF